MQATEDMFTGQTQSSVAVDEPTAHEAIMAKALYSHHLKKVAWFLPMVTHVSV